MYYDIREITPNIEGAFRFNKADESVPRFTSREVEVRALIEGQFLSKRAHAEDLGLKIGKSVNLNYELSIFILYSERVKLLHLL